MLNHAHIHIDSGHWACTALCFLLGARTVTCCIVKRTSQFPFTCTQKKFAKDKREHVDENGVRCYKVKKLKVIKASGALINVSCCRNGNGSCVWGLDSYLESNSMTMFIARSMKMTRTHGVSACNTEKSLLFIQKNAKQNF